MPLSLLEVVAALEAQYDPSWAEPWDAVGLVCGDPTAPVRRVLFAVDPVAAVAEEAVSRGADLLVTHHPLFLRGVHGVAATTPKGRVVHRLVCAGVALFVAHTNADVAAPGVSDALAESLGLADVSPLAPQDAEAVDKLVTFVPPDHVDPVLDALAAAGAGGIGDYRRCAYLTDGTGTFEAGAQTRPAVGRPGERTSVAEVRVELVVPRARRATVVRALLAVHPYEEPAFDLYPLAVLPGPRGLGRLGDLPAAEPLVRFVQRVAGALPPTVWGVRATGDAQRPVRHVAVCGGSGGELVSAAAAAGADVLLTADLRHHPASEAAEECGVALVDAAHWATERPWCSAAAQRLSAAVGTSGADTVEVLVSDLVTDPWTLHRPSAPKET